MIRLYNGGGRGVVPNPFAPKVQNRDSFAPKVQNRDSFVPKSRETIMMLKENTNEFTVEML